MNNNLISICCYPGTNIFGLIGMILSLNYDILNSNNINLVKITDIQKLENIIKCCNDIKRDDKTYISFCFDGTNDERKIFLNNYFNEIENLNFLSTEHKRILKDIYCIVNNLENEKSTGPNGAKNGVISYFINSDLFGDNSVLHFVDDDDISATTLQIRIQTINIKNYAYSCCYKQNENINIYPSIPLDKNKVSNIKNIYGLHELFITKHFIKNIPLLRYGVMNKEDLDYRSRLFYISDDEEIFIKSYLYCYYIPRENKKYKRIVKF